MGASKRRPPRSGWWLVLIAGTVTVLISAAAVFLWISPDLIPASVPGSAAVVPAATAPAVPSVDPRTAAMELAAAAPELTLASAEMLVAEVPNGAGTGLAEMALLFASRGFDTMERAELLELGQLFEEAYAKLAPADHEWMGEYMRALRDGSLDAEGSARGRRLLTESVAGLADDRRQRLQALLEKAIRAGIEARRQAEERTQEARVAPAPDTTAAKETAAPPAARERPAPPSPPGMAGLPASSAPAQPGRGEAYWRSRMREARARVERLRAEVASLEKDAAREVYGPTLEPQCIPPARINSQSQAEYEACLKLKQNWPARQAAAQAQRLDRLAQLREQLAAAERAIGEVEDEARRDGALPGWLRE